MSTPTTGSITAPPTALPPKRVFTNTTEYSPGAIEQLYQMHKRSGMDGMSTTQQQQWMALMAANNPILAALIDANEDVNRADLITKMTAVINAAEDTGFSASEMVQLSSLVTQLLAPRSADTVKIDPASLSALRAAMATNIVYRDFTTSATADTVIYLTADGTATGSPLFPSGFRVLLQTTGTTPQLGTAQLTEAREMARDGRSVTLRGFQTRAALLLSAGPYERAAVTGTLFAIGANT